MEVILLERIGRLGGMGDVVKVKNGYARNSLIPQKKALRATDENKKVFDARRAEMEKERKELEKLEVNRPPGSGTTQPKIPSEKRLEDRDDAEYGDGGNQ